MPKGTTLSGTCLLSLLTAVSGSAQMAPAPQVIKDAIACATCSIKVNHAANLRFAESDAMALPPTAVRQDASGRIWVFESGVIRVFGKDGKFIQKVGRKGAGPGEFLHPNDMFVLPGDSVVVIDVQNNRATVFNRDLKYVRSIVYTHSVEYGHALRWPDSVVMTGESYSPEAAGWPLHIMSFSGNSVRVLKSFGPGSGDLRLGGGGDLRHELAKLPDGTLLSATPASYDVFAWSGFGRQIDHLVRRPQWFVRDSKLGLGGPKKPPLPEISGLWAGNPSAYWVVSRVPSKSWSKAWTGIRPSGREIVGSSIAFEELFDSIVEVIDPRDRTVLARKTVLGWIIGILPGPRLVRYTADSTGDLFLEILDAELAGRKRVP